MSAIELTDTMTPYQRDILKTLSEQARSPEAFDSTLTWAEAKQRIDTLLAILALRPPQPFSGAKGGRLSGVRACERT
jgi:hypothetical protein